MRCRCRCRAELGGWLGSSHNPTISGRCRASKGLPIPCQTQPRVPDGRARAYPCDALLPMRLDVTDRQAAFDTVRRAHEHFGRLDIVVNNAGYGQFGMVEELSEEEVRDQIETNLFGALWVTQAALPFLRAQGSGHFLQVSSIGGISAFPGIGMYHASKWALEGISQSLAQEVRDFGIKVTLIEPGGFSTDWGGASAKRAIALDAYEDVYEASRSEEHTSELQS